MNRSPELPAHVQCPRLWFRDRGRVADAGGSADDAVGIVAAEVETLYWSCKLSLSRRLSTLRQLFALPTNADLALPVPGFGELW